MTREVYKKYLREVLDDVLELTISDLSSQVYPMDSAEIVRVRRVLEQHLDDAYSWITNEKETEI